MSDQPTTSWIVETTEEAFNRDVFERSRTVPVVVDFWAPWCQPCRMLGPMLERLAEKHAGDFVLVKADVDKMPRAAAEFAVQSIPAVYAVRDGQIVDYFVGVMPEPQLRSWLERIMPTPTERLVSQARQVMAEQPEVAEVKLREALRLDPNCLPAAGPLAELLLDSGREDEARAVIEQMDASGLSSPELDKVRAQLELKAMAERGPSIEQARARLAEAPEDPERKLELAEALASHRNFEPALQLCLEVVQRHKATHGDKARRIMVDLFHLLPDDSELVSEYRRKLSLALY